MIVESRESHGRLRLTFVIHERLHIVFRRIKDRVANEFYVLQRFFSVNVFVIITFDHGRFRLRILGIIVQEFGADKQITFFDRICKIGIKLTEQVLVHKLRMEDVTALLNIRDTRFPINIQQIHAFNVNIPKPAKLGGVPNDLINPRSRLHLLPHRVIVGFLEAVLLQHTRNDSRQHSRLASVPFFTGKDVRLWICFHRVRVFADDNIVQPSRLGREALAHKLRCILFFGSVAKLPPVFRSNDPLFGDSLASLVFLQNLKQILDLLRAYRHFHRCRHHLRRRRLHGSVSLIHRRCHIVDSWIHISS